MRKVVGSEENTHKLFVQYAVTRYPGILIHSDYGAGIKLTIGQARKQKALQGGRRAWPDVEVAEPGPIYHGFYQELKKDGTPLLRPKDAAKILKGDYKLRRKGDWYDLHTEEQAHVLAELRDKGYAATFGVGLQQACDNLDLYMAGKYVPYVVSHTKPGIVLGESGPESSPF